MLDQIKAELHYLVAPLHDRFAAIEATIQADRAALDAKFAVIGQFIHHILTGTMTMTDTVHDALLAAVKDLDGLTDTAVSNFEAMVADRDAIKAEHADTLNQADDIKAGIASIGTKLAKITGAVSTSISPPATPITVVAPSEAGSTTLTVTGATEDHVDAPVSGPGIALGTTVDDVDPNPAMGTATVTLSQPTISNHSGDGSETLTISPAASP